MLEHQTQIGSGLTDRERLEASDRLEDLLRSAFKKPGAFDHPFASLTKVASLKSPDGNFRLFNWNVPLTDGTFAYRLLVLREGEKKAIEVKDTEELTHDDENREFDGENWYGAIYYEIHPMKYDGEKVYTLVGWDGHDGLSTKKVLDVLVFEKKNRVSFGLPIFEKDDEYVMRRVFEYSDDVVMNLRWIEAKDAIVFDKLVPTVGGLKGNYAYYGPGTGYSAYVEEKGRWKLEEDFDMSRPRDNRNDARFNFPDRPDFSRDRDKVNPLTGE